jgi:hypothetical protein
LIITDFVRIGIDVSNTYLGCIRESGELVKIGEEYSEENCTRLCVCRTNGIECGPMCPVKTFDLLQQCDLPQTLKFVVIPAGPAEINCFCTTVACVPPPGIRQHSTFVSGPLYFSNIYHYNFTGNSFSYFCKTDYLISLAGVVLFYRTYDFYDSISEAIAHGGAAVYVSTKTFRQEISLEAPCNPLRFFMPSVLNRLIAPI